MRASGVYAILNLFDGKIYTGSSIYIKFRFAWHHRALMNGKHHSILLQRAGDKPATAIKKPVRVYNKAVA